MRVLDGTVRRVNRRKRLAKSLGMQMGTMYEKHVEKFKQSSGYVRDGNLRHYVSCKCKKPIHIKGSREPI